MLIEIKNRFNGKVIYSGEHNSVKEAVRKCVDTGVSLAKANLKDADLECVDLYRANLEWASLESANLDMANLDMANLYRANLKGASLDMANLDMANLEGANLKWADLKWARLAEASLYEAELYRANLEGARLERVNLYGANLEGASLEQARLKGASLTEARLEGASFQGAELPHFQIVPEEGGFYAWKKTTKGVIKIYVPAKAKRTSSLVGRKCRAEFVKVVGGEGVGGKSPTYGDLVYNKGETIYADNYDDDIRLECTGGIHFFMTKKEAEEWK